MDLLTYVRTSYFPQRALKPLTIEQVEVAVRQAIADLGAINVHELNGELIERHILSLVQMGRSATTINRRRRHLLTIWRFAYKRGANDNDPWRADVLRLKEPKRVPLAWSTAEIEAMLQQADRVPSRIHYHFGPRSWRALILLLYYTGLRIKATLKLTRNDLRGKMLLVPAEIQKDNEEAVFQVPVHLANLLRSLPRPMEVRHGRHINEMLIPWPWRMDHIQDKFTKYILEPAGLPIDRRLKFHAIRRTVATIVAAKRGKEAARDILGHSSLAVTERYLADPAMVDPTLEPKLSPMDVLPPLGDAC